MCTSRVIVLNIEAPATICSASLPGSALVDCLSVQAPVVKMRLDCGWPPRHVTKPAHVLIKSIMQEKA